MFENSRNIPDRTEGLGVQLKKLIDDAVARTPGWAGVRVYLYALGHAGKDPYQKPDDSEFQPSVFALTDEGADLANEDRKVIEELNQAFTGERGMKSVLRERAECIEKLGRETVERIEKALCIDSRGIDTGDKKPLLGMKHDLVVNAIKYLLPP